MRYDVDSKFQPYVADVSNNTISITTDPAILRGVLVTTGLSAHDVPIYDGSGGDLVAKIPASSGIGTWIECGDMRCPNGVYVDPNDAATGVISVVYKSQPNFPDY